MASRSAYRRFLKLIKEGDIADQVEGMGASAGTFFGSTRVGGIYGNGLVYAVNAQGGFKPIFYFPACF